MVWKLRVEGGGGRRCRAGIGGVGRLALSG
jgi:hypothetical protein